MLLLLFYILIALCFSFLCSIFEAVILSTSNSYIAVLDQKGKPAGKILGKLKANINRPLSAILILNTIAHTLGAVGAGAQAAIVFGNKYVGVTAVILTILILVLSEIIPKTIGTHYWRQLAPVTAYSLRLLIWLLYPLVLISEKMTARLVKGESFKGVHRGELLAMAELSSREGQLTRQESVILKNLLQFRETYISFAMTPISVVFKLPENMTVAEYYQKHKNSRFSRIPVYSGNEEMIEGFVLRNDLLLAQARGDTDSMLLLYKRPLLTVLDSMTLFQAFDTCIQHRTHIMLVVNEYGGTAGVLTLEDLIETLLGLEIIDESDKTVNMQELARRLWRHRARGMGLDVDAG
jgi:CBS domain containing-hemolysin-like protein